jgi:stress response protein YsnF
LSDLDAEYNVEPGYEDVRGFEVFDSEGDNLGEVKDLLVDTSDYSINYALVGRGWLAFIMGENEVIVPLRKMDIDQEDKSVHLDIVKEQLRDFPDYNTVGDPDIVDKVNAFWGTEQYKRPIEGRERYGRPTTIPVTEERARVSKEMEKVGEIAVTKEEEVERAPVTEEVHGERIEVEREKVPERPLAEYEKEGRRMEPGETVSVPVTEERIRVTKEPVVTEVIKLRKVPTTREVTTEEELRKERVEVEEKKGKEPAA